MRTRDGNRIVFPAWAQWVAGGVAAFLTLAVPAWIELRVTVARIDTQVSDLRDDVRELKAEGSERTQHHVARPVR